MHKDIMFFTDPHIGKVLVSNTTPASRKRLTGRLATAPLKVIEENHSHWVCGGDLFDKFDNPATVVRDGGRVASRCALVLGGNHDVENSLDSYSSLDLVSETLSYTDGGSPVRTPQYNAVHYHKENIGGVTVVAVPHHSTQQLFDSALRHIVGDDSLGSDILLLHCNYDCDMATNDTSLNLTRDVAARLLKNFKFIMIGHDHNPKKDFDGRVIVMGSIHPTCFGDCHVDHKIYGFSAGDTEISEEVVWNADEKYVEYEIDDDITSWDPLAEGAEFVRVTGRMAPEQVPQLAKWVRDAWKRESVFAIRVDAVVVADRNDVEATTGATAISFREMLTNKLADSPELRDVWDIVTGEMGDDQ